MRFKDLRLNVHTGQGMKLARHTLKASFPGINPLRLWKIWNVLVEQKRS